ncbi:pilus assembly PilX family protein [Desulfuromonas thiophila]|uniref:Tfp pilus assembly protein PilX n=1 Tax=Desulfuromonas thiophila TaxID=57664 RepID=A0A1G7E2C2_9BACT|nr:hypothetical protein [Desulfuromonas thiophila]SDE57857.1 Tfp pilus assembly protein PilX [Desulfuromonas thiophila]
MPTPSPLQNEKGSVLIFSLLVLLILTIAGISGLNTTDVEISTSLNSLVYKQNLYEAEGTATEGARWLRNLANDEGSLPGQTFTGLGLTAHDRMAKEDLKNELNTFRNPVNWTAPSADEPNTVAGTRPNTSYRIIDYGAGAGESLSLNNSTGGIKHDYVINGRYSSTSGARQGDVRIEKGLRIRVK